MSSRYPVQDPIGVITADQVLAALLGMELDRRTASVERADEAERAALELNRPDLAARARLVAVDALARRGDLAGAAPVLDEVQAWATRHDDPYVLARSHLLQSVMNTCIGDLAEGRRHAFLGVDHLPDDAPPLVRGAHLLVLALSLDMVESPDAAEYHNEALDIATAAGDYEMCRSVLNNMAFAAYQAGDAQAAAALVERMQRLTEHTGITLRAPDIDTVARVTMMQGRHGEAEAMLLRLLDDKDAEAFDEGNMAAEVLLTLAEAQRLGGAMDRAQASLDECLALCDRDDMADTRVRARQEQARLYAAMGRYREAYEEHCRYDEEARALRSAERDTKAHLAQLVFESREGRRDSERFRDLALRDPLTGLYNRRFIDGQLPALVARAAQDGRPLSVALVDIDFFKQINDTLTHEVGDLVLQRVAAVIAAAVDEPATVARLGGEEFILVIPDADTDDGLARCEQAREAVAGHPWHELASSLSVTVSIGVTTTEDGRTTPAALLSQADRNMYAAKRGGRNRVVGDAA